MMERAYAAFEALRAEVLLGLLGFRLVRLPQTLARRIALRRAIFIRRKRLRSRHIRAQLCSRDWRAANRERWRLFERS
jgi:hypothetical protein